MILLYHDFKRPNPRKTKQLLQQMQPIACSKIQVGDNDLFRRTRNPAEQLARDLAESSQVPSNIEASAVHENYVWSTASSEKEPQSFGGKCVKRKTSHDYPSFTNMMIQPSGHHPEKFSWNSQFSTVGSNFMWDSKKPTAFDQRLHFQYLTRDDSWRPKLFGYSLKGRCYQTQCHETTRHERP